MDGLYEWVEQIAFYSVLLVLVNHMLPAGDQKKYVQFFMGLVFLLLVFSPLFGLLGQEERMADLFWQASHEQELAEFQRAQERLEQDLELYAREKAEEVENEAAKQGDAEQGDTEGGTQEDRLVEPVEIRIGGEQGEVP